MEAKKEDRRIRLTKRAIRESLIELMRQQPISKISVKMICETADINRSTFYAHYKDQYSLLRTLQQEVITDLKAQIFSTQFFDASESAVSVLVQMLEYGKANAPLLKVLLSEYGDASFQNELVVLANEKLMEELSGDKTIPFRSMQYLRQFAVGGLLNIIRQWLGDDCVDSPEMLADLMIQLIVNGMKGLLSKQ